MAAQPSTYNYVVSASRETVISHSVTGAFIGEDSIDVICDKGTRIEVRSLKDADRLDVVASVPVFGRVEALRLIRPLQEAQQKDWLFVLTDRNHFFVLSFENGKVTERASGDLTEKVGRKHFGSIVAVDPKSRFVVCYLYTGLLSLIPFDSRTGQAKDASIMPLEELNVLDLCFSSASGRSLLCVLYKDTRLTTHLKTYDMQTKNVREFTPGPWSQPYVDPTANRLLPIHDGVVVFSSTSIVHLREVSNPDSQGAASRSTVAGTPAATPGGAAAGSISASSVGPNQPTPTTLPITFGQVEAVGLIEKDGSRMLLGDEYGGLHVLSITPLPNQANVKLSIELLGETSIATGICYLDAGIVFIGSHAGDSQLIRLLPERDEATQSSLELLDPYTNLGPINSMCVVDLDKQGRGQVVTCSGIGKDGSIRIIRNGVGVDEQCEVDLPGIKGMWSIKQSKDSMFDAFLVQSFPTETRVFGFDDVPMEVEGEESGEQMLAELTVGSEFDCDSNTLYCGNVADDVICQVTPTRVRFIKCSVLSNANGDGSNRIAWEWTPPNGARITVAAGAPENKKFGLALALTGASVVVISGSSDPSVKHYQMEHEVACVALSQHFVAVGLWTDLSVRIIHVESGKQVHHERSFGEDALPRSLVLTRFGVDQRKLHLLVGLGDGRLVCFLLDDATGAILPNWRRALSLGVQPVELALFDDPTSNNKHVFAACDRPAIIYMAANDKLLLSNVNLAMEVTRATSFNSEQFPACLALALEDRLIIGMVNDVQRLHIKTVPLHEQPRRIAHQPSSNTFAVLTIKADGEGEMDNAQGGETGHYGPGVDSPESSDQCYVRLLDDRTFDMLDFYRLDEAEMVISLISMSFYSEGDGEMDVMDDSRENSKAYYVVGTAYTDGDEDPRRGRILVLEVIRMEGDERKLNLVAEKSTKGGVYDLCAYNGKLLAGVNAMLQMYRWNDKPPAKGEVARSTTTTTTTSANTPGTVAAAGAGSSGELLSHEGTGLAHTLSLFVRSEGKRIIVGDLVKSLALYEWDSGRNSFEEKARDYKTSWVTALAALDESTYLHADNQHNLIVMSPQFGETAEEPGKLTVNADFHWGDFVNVFTKGSLVMRGKQDEEDVAPTSNGEITVRAQPRLLFGTAGGAIGVLATLSEKDFTLLDRLQVAMNEVVTGVGSAGQKFLDWRAFRGGNKTHPCKGFIDGDLVEMLLEMNNSDVEKVVELMNKGLAEKTGSVVTDEPPRVNSTQLINLVEELARLH